MSLEGHSERAVVFLSSIRVDRVYVTRNAKTDTAIVRRRYYNFALVIAIVGARFEMFSVGDN